MNHTDLVLTTKALYDWVDERAYNYRCKSINDKSRYKQYGFDRMKKAHLDTLERMRTLFAGLIDFENYKENTKHGL